MCSTEDCNNGDTPREGIERRTFLTGVTAAVCISGRLPGNGTAIVKPAGGIRLKPVEVWSRRRIGRGPRYHYERRHESSRRYCQLLDSHEVLLCCR